MPVDPDVECAEVGQSLTNHVHPQANGGYDVEAIVLRCLLDEPTVATRWADLTAVVVDSVVTGVRVGAVQSPQLEALGLVDGDVIEIVNELSVAKLAEARKSLRAAKHVTLVLLRGGSRITREYRLRPSQRYVAGG